MNPYRSCHFNFDILAVRVSCSASVLILKQRRWSVVETLYSHFLLCVCVSELGWGRLVVCVCV